MAIAKWILRKLASDYEVNLSFAPKITVGKAGSGLHIHMMLEKDGKNMMVENGKLSDAARKMIAGILDLSDALTAFGNTIPTSYLRLVPHQEAPTNICWGDRNRSVLERVPLGWIGSNKMIYDAIIIGSGPAGMAAMIYLLRAGKNVIMFEKEAIGGQIASAPLVENYPGIKQITGEALADDLYEQVDELGGDIYFEAVTKISIEKNYKIVITEDEIYKTKNVIIAAGCKHKLLSIENESKLLGNGISCCVTCDGVFYKNQEVAIVGGGDSALINALYLSNICKKVYLIHRRDSFRGTKKQIEKVNNTKNIIQKLNCNIKELVGKDSLKQIILDNNGKLDVSGLFLSIGLNPELKFINKNNDYKINTEEDYIKVNSNMQTNIEGIYATGDCTLKKVRQLTTAVNDGTIAACHIINKE
jgi:thioredoxin reductase (NADPH)